MKKGQKKMISTKEDKLKIKKDIQKNVYLQESLEGCMMRIIASAAGMSAKLTEGLIERFLSLQSLRLVYVLFPFTQVSSRVCGCEANLKMLEVSMRRHHDLIVLNINIKK